MKSSAKNIKLQSFDDLFAGGDSGGQEGQGGEQIREIALEELFPFHDHPFKVLDDESMNEMAESIRAHGVLVPGIARPRKEGGYELIAGHRRKRASELAGMATMPVIIRETEDDDAVLAMVDSNLQRENLLPSEKAWAYRMKLEAINRKGGRPAKDNCGQVVHNFRGKKSLEIVAEDTGENYKQVQRYIRLTELKKTSIQSRCGTVLSGRGRAGAAKGNHGKAEHGSLAGSGKTPERIQQGRKAYPGGHGCSSDGREACSRKCDHKEREAEGIFPRRVHAGTDGRCDILPIGGVETGA